MLSEWSNTTNMTLVRNWILVQATLYSTFYYKYCSWGYGSYCWKNVLSKYCICMCACLCVYAYFFSISIYFLFLLCLIWNCQFCLLSYHYVTHTRAGFFRAIQQMCMIKYYVNFTYHWGWPSSVGLCEGKDGATLFVMMAV